VILGDRSRDEGVSSKANQPGAIVGEAIEQLGNRSLGCVEASLSLRVIRQHRAGEIEPDEKIHRGSFHFNRLKSEERTSERHSEERQRPRN
jgi:hypothetical protein